MTFKSSQILTILAASLALAGCTPSVAQRGNMIEDYQLERLQNGVSTRSDVLRAMGSPTTVSPFNDNIWYYIGQEKEKRGIFDPKVTKERIIAVAFNADGIVQSINNVDNGRENIPIENETTPTHGNESNVMQEFFGNLGKFNPNQ